MSTEEILCSKRLHLFITKKIRTLDTPFPDWVMKFITDEENIIKHEQNRSIKLRQRMWTLLNTTHQTKISRD